MQQERATTVSCPYLDLAGLGVQSYIISVTGMVATKAEMHNRNGIEQNLSPPSVLLWIFFFLKVQFISTSSSRPGDHRRIERDQSTDMTDISSAALIFGGKLCSCIYTNSKRALGRGPSSMRISPSSPHLYNGDPDHAAPHLGLVRQVVHRRCAAACRAPTSSLLSPSPPKRSSYEDRAVRHRRRLNKQLLREPQSGYESGAGARNQSSSFPSCSPDSNPFRFRLQKDIESFSISISELPPEAEPKQLYICPGDLPGSHQISEESRNLRDNRTFPAMSLRRLPPRSMVKSCVKFATRTRLFYYSKDGDDWLSNLPDDILLAIIERLDIVDVARFSILSRRWKQIPAMLSKIVITVDRFEGRRQASNKKLPYYDAVQLNSTLIEATRSILGSRSPNLYTIRQLRIKFYLGDDSIFIGQTVANTIATQNVGFAEFEIMTKNEGRPCTAEDRVNYGRQLVSFVFTCPNAFSRLTSLKLQRLRLAESAFPKIFGICRGLEFLRLDYCDMGMLSFLELEHPQLSELEIVNCCFEMVDLKWLPKLTLLTFSGWISVHDPLSFGYVPLLQSVNMTNVGLSWHKMLKLSEFLGQATINDLHFNFKSEKIWIAPEGPRELRQVFHKLRIVELINISEDCDLTWIMFILQGAPYLKELCIRVWDHLCEVVRDKEKRKEYAYSEKKDNGLEWDTSASDFMHHNLVVLRIFGFQIEGNFMNLIRNVMEVAVNLESIYLYNKPVCKTCQHMVGKPSRYPGSWKQKNSLRNKISEGLSSAAEIYFPRKVDC